MSAGGGTTVRSEIRPVFSHDIFAAQRIGGVTRYFCELHAAFLRMGVPSNVIAPLHRCVLLDGLDNVRGLRIPEQLQIRGTKRISDLIDRLVEPAALALLRAREHGTVFHRTYYSSVPPSGKQATALTVYDMIHERHPAMFGAADELTRRKLLWCRRADVVIAISAHTKAELVALSDLDPGRIVVCHLGVTTVEPDSETRERLSSSPPYFLYVGQRSGHKNFDLLVRAFAAGDAARNGFHLVAFGGGNPTPGELALLESCGVSDLVSFARGEDSKLAAHYATAVALLYPSLDEGFGLPPLEAMRHGCPVAASDAGAIPEVVDDCALLFDPTAVESMVSAIDRIASDTALRASLAARGAGRAGTFTWERTASATLLAYGAALERADAHL